MIEREVLAATDEWIKNLKNLLPSVSSENQEYVQSRIELLERLREQVERVHELENEVEKWKFHANKFSVRYFKEKADRYREALEFYANRINYQTFIECGQSNIEHDKGEKARKALEGDDD